MTLFAIVVLALAGVGVYLAYKNPQLGGALLVGIAIVTVLWLIGEDPFVDPTQPGSGTSFPTSSVSEPVPSPTPSSEAVPEPIPPGSPASPLSG